MRYFGCLLSVAALLILTGCPPDRERVNPETEYEPVLMKRSKLDSTIQLEPPKAIEGGGKIYHKDGYIFVNQKYEGIHVINNEDPSNPEKIGFIRIPGNVDMAIKGTTLYADNATDLVAIDLKNYENMEVTKRVPDVFPKYMPPDNGSIPDAYKEENRPDNTVIIKWVKKDWLWHQQ